MVSLLYFIGTALIIVGVITGIHMGNKVNGALRFFSEDAATEFQVKVAAIYWIVGFLSGMVFIALARIIDLLEQSTGRYKGN